MIVVDSIRHYVQDSHKNVETFAIVFGNKEHGWECDKQELVKCWRTAIHLGRYIMYGDVDLYYKGKLIRSTHNLDVKLLNKKADYFCQYNKH